jgi:hypothetical protein
MADWLAGIPAAWPATGSLAGLLVLNVVAVISGRLVPAKTLEKFLLLHAQRLAEEKARGDQWRAAWEVERQRADEQAKSFDLVLEAARTTNALVEGLKAAAEPRARSRP